MKRFVLIVLLVLASLSVMVRAGVLETAYQCLNTDANSSLWYADRLAGKGGAATDGNYATFTAPFGGAAASSTIDAGVALYANQINASVGNAASGCSQSYALQASLDSSSWTTVYQTSAIGGNERLNASVQIDPASGWRYFRVFASLDGGCGNNQLYEFNAYTNPELCVAHNLQLLSVEPTENFTMLYQAFSLNNSQNTKSWVYKDTRVGRFQAASDVAVGSAATGFGSVKYGGAVYFIYSAQACASTSTCGFKIAKLNLTTNATTTVYTSSSADYQSDTCAHMAQNLRLAVSVDGYIYNALAFTCSESGRSHDVYQKRYLNGTLISQVNKEPQGLLKSATHFVGNSTPGYIFIAIESGGGLQYQVLYEGNTLFVSEVMDASNAKNERGVPIVFFSDPDKQTAPEPITMPITGAASSNSNYAWLGAALLVGALLFYAVKRHARSRA